MQDEFLVTDDDGVAGVVSSLSANDEVRALGQEVDNLALAFIAPLEAVYDGVHGFEPRINANGRELLRTGEDTDRIEAGED
jgi:hypothetical protein